MFGQFGKTNHEAAFAVASLVAFGLAVFGTHQHVLITSIIPDQPNMLLASLASGALLLSTVFWSALLRQIGLIPSISIALGFLVGHALFAVAGIMPDLVTTAYVLVVGALGLIISVFFCLRKLSIRLILYGLSAVLLVPVLWLTVGWVAFALPHSNFFNAFVADRSVNGTIVDFLHQRAYVQMVHNYGVPSIGLNGLGYHAYHWLVAYPLSTIATVSSTDVLAVHANILPGFTGPVLLHGIATGVVLASRKAIHGVLILLVIGSLYLLGMSFHKLITYGLVFLTPSTAYSLGLAAPVLGLFLWYFKGNLGKLRSWHFVILLGFVVIVGLAKVSSVFQVALLMGGLWFAFVANGQKSFGGKASVTALTTLAALVSIALVYEATLHNRTDPPTPTAYLEAFNALDIDERTNIEIDAESTLLENKRVVSASSTQFENSEFYQSANGLATILATLALMLLLLRPRLFRRHRLSRWIMITLILSLVVVVQRSFFGFTRPTQVTYILLPSMLLGAMALGDLLGDLSRSGVNRIPRSLGKEFKQIALAGTVLLFVGFMLLAAGDRTVGYVRNAAASEATKSLGSLANPQGRRLIAQLTGQRVGLFGFSQGDPWPAAASRYWEAWDNRPAAQIKRRLAEIKATDNRSAVFVSADSSFWSMGRNIDDRSPMFWIQGSIGLPLYRGKLNLTGLPTSGFRGRGISDYSNVAASPLTFESSVFCWERFRGFKIVNIEGQLLLQC